jgi:hypothetical protein
MPLPFHCASHPEASTQLDMPMPQANECITYQKDLLLYCSLDHNVVYVNRSYLAKAINKA